MPTLTGIDWFQFTLWKHKLMEAKAQSNAMPTLNLSDLSPHVILIRIQDNFCQDIQLMSYIHIHIHIHKIAEHWFGPCRSFKFKASSELSSLHCSHPGTHTGSLNNWLPACSICTVLLLIYFFLPSELFTLFTCCIFQRKW